MHGAKVRFAASRSHRLSQPPTGISHPLVDAGPPQRIRWNPEPERT
jgi:hypothetical protein